MSAVGWLWIVLAALSLYRFFVGPSFWDRVVSVHLLSSQTLLAICWQAVYEQRAYYLDVAVVWALLSFAETIALARWRAIREGSVEQ